MDYTTRIYLHIYIIDLHNYIITKKNQWVFEEMPAHRSGQADGWATI